MRVALDGIQGQPLVLTVKSLYSCWKVLFQMTHNQCPMCGGKPSELQKLLDEHNLASNEHRYKDRQILADKIKSMRDPALKPPCHGEDDCSTLMLIHCVWSIDCGS